MSHRSSPGWWAEPVSIRDIRIARAERSYEAVFGRFRTARTAPAILRPLTLDLERDAELNSLPLEAITGVGGVLAERLGEHGYTAIGDVATADLDDLARIHGIGAITAETIRTDARRLVTETVGDGVIERRSRL